MVPRTWYEWIAAVAAFALGVSFRTRQAGRTKLGSLFTLITIIIAAGDEQGRQEHQVGVVGPDGAGVGQQSAQRGGLGRTQLDNAQVAQHALAEDDARDDQGR